MGKRHTARRSAYAISALTLAGSLAACGSSSTQVDTSLKPSQSTSTANVAPPSTTSPTTGMAQPSSSSPAQTASPSNTPLQAAPSTTHRSAAQPSAAQNDAEAQINGSPGVPKLSEITQQPQLPGTDARSCGTVNFDGAAQPLRVSPQTSCDFARAVVAKNMSVGYADHLVAKSPSTNLYYPMRCYGEDGLNSCWGGHGAIVSWGQVIGQ